uniref:Uncharacterized protein n=2 Tax=Caenorhabditis japonica TaxID=281687 RepID=A0A8R1HKM9_CAEJA
MSKTYKALNDLEWNESLASVCSDSDRENSFNRESLRQANASLVPPYIRHHCDKPKSVGLKFSYDAPTKQTTYTYILTWDSYLGSELNHQIALDNKTRKSDILTQDTESSIYSSKPSTATSYQSSSCSTQTPAKNSTTQKFCKSSNSSSNIEFRSTIDKDRIIGVQLIFVEPGHGNGVFYKPVKININSSDTLKRALVSCFNQDNRNVKEHLKKGTLYAVNMRGDRERNMSYVPKSEYEKHQLYMFSKCPNQVTFVFDMNDFVANGVPVYF